VDGDGGPGQGFGNGVAVVVLDACEDEGGFGGSEEGAAGYWGGQGGAVGEVNYCDVPEEAEEDSYGAFPLDALVGV
jgi:hypothetical protein